MKMDVLKVLRSNDSSKIIDTLYRLGSGRGGALTTEVVEALGRLVDHNEPEVREEVAAAAGIRLRLPELYPMFLRRLQGVEKVPSVLASLIDGATALSLHGEGNRTELSTVLGRYVLDSRQDDDVRGTAYLALLKLWDKITPAEYAIAPRALSEMSWDREFVKSFAH
jgi:hypothetical protein